MQPDIQSSFVYDGKTILLDWYTVRKKADIPDLPWSQVYAVGNFHGLVPLVTSTTSAMPYNLPGGTVEPGETIEQTLKRELIEECNMRVVSWEPLGYQVCTEPDGMAIPQFRVYAVLEKIGNFTHDPGGGVISNTLVTIDEMEPILHYGAAGEVMTKLAKPYFMKDTTPHA